MELYQAITSWALFLGLGVLAVLYYWPDAQRKQPANKQSTARPSARQASSYADAVKSGTAENKKQVRADGARKREAETKKSQQQQQSRAAAVVSQPITTRAARSEEPEADDSTLHFAEQMLKARKGEVITSNKSQEQRIRTVKQSNAASAPAVAAEAGDVSDMLEPKASGPNVLRVTPSTKPTHEKVNRPVQEEQVETKKQRQNRKKVEERRQLREAEEAERKLLMEKQRRTARESRGEPARNGIPASTPTTNNIWTTPHSAPVNEAPAHQPLLDTFDAESTGSSTGALANSTAATSTDGGVNAYLGASLAEEEQVALAMKESGDESGWTTVAIPSKKQQKKKGGAAGGEETPVPAAEKAASKAAAAAPKVAFTNGRPKGFQALEVQYEQRTDADPNDPESWDA